MSTRDRRRGRAQRPRRRRRPRPGRRRGHRAGGRRRDRRRHPHQRGDRARPAARPLLGDPPDGGRLAVPRRPRPGALRAAVAPARDRLRASARRRAGPACCTARSRRPPTGSGPTASGGGGCSHGRRPATTCSPRTSCGRCCACRTTRCGWPASARPRCCPAAVLARLFRTDGGAGAVGRGGRARLPPAAPAAHLGDRARHPHRRPPPRLAGGRGRLAVDQPTPWRRCWPTSAARSRPACGSTSADQLPPSRRDHVRPRARGRRRHPRRPAATAGRPRLPAVPPRPGRVQGRLRRRGRRAVDQPRGALGPARSTSAAPSPRSPPPSGTIHAGRMPERPFVLVGQQYLADPTALGRRHPPGVGATPTCPHGYTATPPRRSSPRSSGSPRASATGSSAWRSGAPRRCPATTRTSSAATSSPAPRSPPAAVRPPHGPRPVRHRGPGHVPVLGRHPARRRRPRHVRRQRRRPGTAPTQGLANQQYASVLAARRARQRLRDTQNPE